MTNFTKEDLATGWKVCPVCRVRVFQLDAGFDAKETICERCNCHTVGKKDFFINDVIEVMSK